MRSSFQVALLLLLSLPAFSQRGYFTTQFELKDAQLNHSIRETILHAIEERKVTVFMDEFRTNLIIPEIDHVTKWMQKIIPTDARNNSEVSSASGKTYSVSEISPREDYFSSKSYECLFYWDSGKQEGGLYGIAFPVELGSGNDDTAVFGHICELYFGDLRKVLPKNMFDTLLNKAERSMPLFGQGISTIPHTAMQSVRELKAEDYRQPYGFGIEKIMESTAWAIDNMHEYTDAALSDVTEGMGSNIVHRGQNDKQATLQSVFLLEEWTLDTTARASSINPRIPGYPLNYICLRHNIRSIGFLFTGSGSYTFRFWMNYYELEKFMRDHYPAYLKAFETCSEADLAMRLQLRFKYY